MEKGYLDSDGHQGKDGSQLGSQAVSRIPGSGWDSSSSKEADKSTPWGTSLQSRGWRETAILSTEWDSLWNLCLHVSPLIATLQKHSTACNMKSQLLATVGKCLNHMNPAYSQPYLLPPAPVPQTCQLSLTLVPLHFLFSFHWKVPLCIPIWLALLSPSDLNSTFALQMPFTIDLPSTISPHLFPSENILQPQTSLSAYFFTVCDLFPMVTRSMSILLPSTMLCA